MTEAQSKIDSIQKSFSVFDNSLFALNSFNGGDCKSSILYQFKDLKVTLQQETISFIEKLNGFEWKGNILLSATAVRSIKWSTIYCINPILIKDATWKEWTNLDNWEISIIKKRGIWRIKTTKFFEIADPPNSNPPIDMVKDLVTKPMIDTK